MLKSITCKTALRKLNKSKLPYDYDLNIYRGCSHGCRYCYALYSHRYLDGGDFYSDIYYKQGITELLEQELKRIPRDCIVNIGSVCDSYQPAEEELEIMPKVLKLFIKFRVPVVISTKSELILRDIDLIDELSRCACVNIAASIITTEDRLAKLIEPGAALPSERLRMLSKINEYTKAGTGLHCMPVLPYITDGEDNFRRLFEEAKKTKVDYVLTGGLNMRGASRRRFTEFVKERFGEVYPDFVALENPNVKKEYKENLYAMLDRLYQEYGLTPDFQKHIKMKLEKQTYFSFSS